VNRPPLFSITLSELRPEPAAWWTGGFCRRGSWLIPLGPNFDRGNLPHSDGNRDGAATLRSMWRVRSTARTHWMEQLLGAPPARLFLPPWQ
jgi:hypothetical protein